MKKEQTTITQINNKTKKYGFIVTNNYQFVIITEKTKGKLITEFKKFTTAYEVWEYIIYTGLLNIRPLLENVAKEQKDDYRNHMKLGFTKIVKNAINNINNQ